MYSLKNCFSSNTDSELLTAPTLSEFMHKGMLVHVGSLCFNSETTQASIDGWQPVTYWTLNGPVPNTTFINKHRRATVIVLTPLKKHIQNIVSVCAQEVMHLGECILDKDDIVLIHTKGTRDTFYTTEEWGQISALIERDKSIGNTSYYVDITKTPVQLGSFREFYTEQEIALLHTLGIEVRAELDFECAHTSNCYHTDNNGSAYSKIKNLIRNTLESRGCWYFDFSEEFWTHKTPFIMCGKQISNQQLFFKNVLDTHSHVSFGYEFLSLSGYGSIFRILNDLSENIIFYTQYPDTYHFFSEVLSEFICGHIEALIIESDHKIKAVRKIKELGFPKSVAEEEVLSSQEIKPLDCLLLDVLLPLSQEFFDKLEQIINEKELLQDVWPVIKTAYDYSRVHVQTSALTLPANGKVIHDSLSKEARSSLFKLAVGYNILQGDGYEIEGDPSYDTAVDYEMIRTTRMANFNEKVSEWFQKK